MTTPDPVEITPAPASATGTTAPSATAAPDPGPTAKQRAFDAAGVLVTAVLLGLERSGRLGGAPFSLQVVATSAGISLYPTLYRGAWFWRLPTFVRTVVMLAWVGGCFAPCFVALVMELFTGHRRPGAQWWDALWRVYAILALWIGFAVLNERIVRPWWRRVSADLFKSARDSSVAVQNRERAMDRRKAALEGIKARTVLALRRRDRIAKTLKRREDTDAPDAAQSVADAELRLRRAREKAALCTRTVKEAAEEGEEGEKRETAQEEVKAAGDAVEKCEDAVQTAKLHERSMRTDIDRCKMDLDSIDNEIDMLKQEWTTALHIDNHVEFAR